MPELGGCARHEILEATTNPDPATRGFAFKGESPDGGVTAAGVEPADPCGLITMGERGATESGFAVQRVWSNRAAARGQDPCVPAPAERPYLALVPDEPTVRLPEVGDSVSVALEAPSDRPVGEWRVEAIDLARRDGRRPCLDARLDRSTVNSGASAELSLTLRRKDPRQMCFVGLISSLGEHRHLWPLAVVTR